MELKIRTITPHDLDAVIALETSCFPPETAATREAFTYRIAAFPERFFVAEQDGQILGLINGCASSLQRIADALYEPQGHEPDGKNQMIFGLAVHPDHRGKGIGTALMHAMIHFAEQAQMERLVLTCRAEKVAYYQRFGYIDHGVSQSTHGGVVWHDMILEL